MTRPRNWNDVAHMDIDVEIENARRYADHFDAFLTELGARPKTSELTTDTTCCQCGRRLVLSGAVDPLARYVCADCSRPDEPPYRPNTGFGA